MLLQSQLRRFSVVGRRIILLTQTTRTLSHRQVLLDFHDMMLGSRRWLAELHVDLNR